MTPKPDDGPPARGDAKPVRNDAAATDEEPIRPAFLVALVIVVLLIGVGVVVSAEGASLASFTLGMLGVGCFSAYVWKNRRAKVWPIFWRDENGEPQVLEHEQIWLVVAGLVLMLLAGYVS